MQKIISAFQDYDNLYLVTNFYDGITLNYYKDEIMTEQQIKFISACVIYCFKLLRKEKIIHRDISMKNLIFDEKNYINLLDFSYAIPYSEKDNFKYYLFGFPVDRPPEIQKISKYDYNFDYYKLGMIIYYLIFKKNINDVKKENNLVDLLIDNKSLNNYSSSCIDFLNKLIIVDIKKRIGYLSINELINHPWFKGFDWKKLEDKKLKSPLKFKKIYNKINCTKFIFSEKNQKKYNENLKRIYNSKLSKKYGYVNNLIINKILKINMRVKQYKVE